MSHSADWILAIDWDESGRARLSGVPTARRGELEVFFAGWLADRGEWAREIGATPETDLPNLILCLVDRDGTAVVSRLRGSFAVAIADHRRAEVRVSRDPLGSHPLFYAQSGRTLLVASTPQPLLRQPGVSRSLNREALADHLCKRWPDRQETFFEAVRRVPPGWEVRSTAGTVAPARYWNPVGRDIEWLSQAESDQFDAVLDRAVDRGLQNGRAGIFLSGGFDSVSVAAVAADRSRLAGQQVPLALSLGFPAADCNEQPVQKAVARTLGLPLHLVDFYEAAGPRGLLAEALDLNAGLAAPCFNTWAPAYAALLRHATSEGIRTIFTGEGGDEWLGVTPFLAADMLRRGQLLSMVRLARTTQRSYDLGWTAVLRGAVWRHAVRPVAGMFAHRLLGDVWDRRRAARAHNAILPWVAPDPAIRHAQFDRALHNLTAADPAGGFYSRESRVFLDHPLTSWLFEEQFQLGQRLGVRYVHPYWDPDLLVHAYRTPPERLNQGGRSKGLVRQTVSRRFPQLGFERQRKVTALRFFADLARAEGPVLGERIADFAALGSLGVVDPDGARAYMRQAWHQAPQEVGRAWNLVNLESWTRSQLH